MATIGTRLHTLFKGKFVGKDEYGNAYYEERKVPKGRRRKRWVIYNGQPEPSKVPAHWHGWLHYTTDKAPITGESPYKHKWQKEHQPT